MFWTHQTRIARAEEDAAARKAAPLRDQGFDERLRLGAGLSQIRPSPGRMKLLSSADSTTPALVEAAVHDELFADRAGKAHLQVPFARHIEVQSHQVFARP